MPLVGDRWGAIHRGIGPIRQQPAVALRDIYRDRVRKVVNDLAECVRSQKLELLGKALFELYGQAVINRVGVTLEQQDAVETGNGPGKGEALEGHHGARASDANRSRCAWRS